MESSRPGLPEALGADPLLSVVSRWTELHLQRRGGHEPNLPKPITLEWRSKETASAYHSSQVEMDTEFDLLSS